MLATVSDLVGECNLTKSTIAKEEKMLAESPFGSPHTTMSHKALLDYLDNSKILDIFK